MSQCHLRNSLRHKSLQLTPIKYRYMYNCTLYTVHVKYNIEPGKSKTEAEKIKQKQGNKTEGAK